MSELEKKITGDWYEIRSTLDEPDKLVDLLEMEAPEFNEAAERLRFAIDEGVVEYKRDLLHSLMTPLKSLKWDSKAITALERSVRQAAVGVLTPAVQRLFALGMLRLYNTKNETQEENPHSQEPEEQKVPDIKTIVAEVQEMVKDRPELRTHQEVKRIMMQLKNYNTELEKMRSLAPNIPREKQEGFKRNFQEIFDDITEKIQNAYRSIINEEYKDESPAENLPILKRYDFFSMEKLYRSQVENAARIYSTIRFAEQERFQMREVLVELAAGEPFYEGFFKRELEQYNHLAPFGDDSLKISRAFGDQISRYYDRYAEWIKR